MRQDKGVNGDAQRLEQLGWMLFLKIFDAKDEDLEEMDETGEYASPVPEKYQWRNWAADDEGITGDGLINFIDRELFPDLANLKSTDKRAQIIRDVFGGNNNYMKSGQLFRQVVNELNKIDFHASKDLQVFGNVYETLLKELQSAGSSGEFYTPRAVVQFMTEITNPKLGEKVLDPACGTGGFLTSAIEHIRKAGVDNIEQRKQLQNSVRGMELKPLPHMLATTNLILHDIEVPDISYEDSLLQNQSIKAKNRVDVILANPPFGGNVDDATASTFPVGFRTKESADLFLVMMVNYLKQGGRAALVLPDGSLTGDGIKARIREMLLRNCNLHTIIRLPNSVFKPYATVATNLLFFDKVSSPAEEQEDFATKEIWYYEHQLPEGSKGYSMTKPIRVEEFDVEKEWWKNRVESEFSWKINIADIIKKAIQDAKPHYEKEKQLKREAYSLKEKITQLKREDKTNGDLEQLQKQLQETETNARIEKQTADNLYYNAFDLDFKNPNKNEEDLGDPAKILEKQNLVLVDIEKIKNEIEKELKPAIFQLNLKELQNNFGRYTNTKANILNLRQLILQIAVRGMLTKNWRSENSNTKAASYLISNIKAEKKKLIKEGKIKKQKPLAPISSDEKAFSLPVNWEWTRLANYTEIIMGQSPKSESYNEIGDGLPFYQGKKEFGKVNPISVSVWCNEPSRIAFENDILISVRAPVGDVNIANQECAIGRGLAIIRPILIETLNYLFYFLNFQKDRWITKGSFFQSINSSHVNNMVIPIPPIDEQKEIVSKVKQLMSWCDELEKKIDKRDVYQDKMMQAVVKQAFKTDKE